MSANINEGNWTFINLARKEIMSAHSVIDSNDNSSLSMLVS